MCKDELVEVDRCCLEQYYKYRFRHHAMQGVLLLRNITLNQSLSGSRFTDCINPIDLLKCSGSDMKTWLAKVWCGGSVPPPCL